jgi:hypothetical protein
MSGEMHEMGGAIHGSASTQANAPGVVISDASWAFILAALGFVLAVEGNIVQILVPRLWPELWGCFALSGSRIGHCSPSKIICTASETPPVTNRTLPDVPPSIGPVVFGTLGVGWVMVQCPHEYDELMRGAGVSGNLARGNGW